MALKLIFLYVLCLVVACRGMDGAVDPEPPKPTEESGNGTSTPSPPNTTEESGNGTSTPKPPNTTEESGNGTSTPKPPNTTEESGNGTSTPEPPNTTAGSTTIAPQPTPTPDPCLTNPCGQGSTCEPRANNQDFACLCLGGDFYNNASKSCESSKVFPGILSLPGMIYNANMANKQSEDFVNASNYITTALDSVFSSNGDYSGSTVLELKPIPARSSGVTATVDIAFKASADITTADVTKKITESSCPGCPLPGASFIEENLCNRGPCDGETAVCKEGDGSYNCSCKENYVATELSHRICIACPSGRQAVDSKCVACSFGYSGFNCNESWKLVLVIVASVLGALLVIAIIVLPIVSYKSAKKSSKKNKAFDTGKTHVQQAPVEAPLVNRSSDSSRAPSTNGSVNLYANAGVPRIPRATSNWDRTNLEMTQSNSRQNLVPGGKNPRVYEDYEDVMPQNRPQSNLYSQNRSNGNPYVSRQGQSNPYFLNDDGGRRN